MCVDAQNRKALIHLSIMAKTEQMEKARRSGGMDPVALPDRRGQAASGERTRSRARARAHAAPRARDAHKGDAAR